MLQAAHRSHPTTYWWGGPRALSRKSRILWMRPVICTRYSDIVGDLGTYKSHRGVHGRVRTSSEMPLSPRTPTSCPEHAFSFYPSRSHVANKSQLKSCQALPMRFWAITLFSKSHGPSSPKQITWYLITQWNVLFFYYFIYILVNTIIQFCASLGWFLYVTFLLQP